ncbi:ribosomal protein S18-alanine N-acetyltransferase [Roseomonas marmotae]|uniref:[Ribosomal protein bS18]-alanine N-acetyltransferase n=1 Tax=Roseomonas marmotae TaxID=2768161 RepID=A0ABS3K722_9PROT|nr:ribosomal protein S18-alanine N-acetyltransferase [Roseomonas marmotae]MBO1073256.1 ribosomal protein S18-alanine N-acetyltransferase [Roseomonas marmotae]QTI79120.1 ribosomal protein S18-alanine N-acetyltransferase [Roseomonas marmotae]
MTSAAPLPEPLGEADAPALAALHASAFPPAEAWGADAIALMLGLEGAFGFGLAGQGFILARAVAGEAEVLTLAVAPAARRRGLAAALLLAAIDEARLRDAEVMFLEVSDSNTAARALYERAGFAQVGLRRRYYADGSDALVLSRCLSAA